MTTMVVTGILVLLATSCAGPQKADAAKTPPSADLYPATEGSKGRERPAPRPVGIAVSPPKSSLVILKPRKGSKTASAPKTGKLPALLEEIEAKYATASTLSAEFTQINEMAALKQKKSSQGTIVAKRPGKVRWETVQPEQNLLVSDGRTFWFYTPPFDETEHGQVIERRSSEVQSKLANALLSGSFSMARDMKIEQTSPSEFVLLPKPGSAGTIERAEIAINLDKKVIEKVTLEHKGGNRSEISLHSIELGKSLGDELFKFTAPPNTDRVDP